MGVINRLREEVINQIAAGEVVERPVSIVRELVDNSLDAGATEIAIMIEEGGTRLIKVSDNGSGMGPDDALLCFDRHATSKISDSEGLNKISTLGFRGEALSSIAAVSRVTLTTRPGTSPTGVRVEASAGVLSEAKETGCAVGTEIIVRDLFFNTPARKKFLKSAGTEQDKIKKWLMQFAIAWPAVRFKLVADGKEILSISADPSAIERGKRFVKGTGLAFEDRVGIAGGEVKIVGYLGHPRHVSSALPGTTILVNSRLVSDKIIIRAVKDGFSSMLGGGEQPLGFIALSLPPSIVDVNVHPQKSEVRFRDSQVIYQFVRGTISKSITKIQSPRDIPGSRSDLLRSGVPTALSAGGESSSVASAPPAYSAQGGLFAYSSPMQHSDLHRESPRSFKFEQLKYVGQVLGCYLVCEHNDAVVIVDMHAAHERVNYNIIRNRYSEHQISSQALLSPVVISMTKSERDALLQEHDVLARFGFEIEDYGGAKDCFSVIVRSAPSAIKPASIEPLVREILDLAGQAELSTTNSKVVIDKRIDQICARLACHASIRSGHVIKKEEALALFTALDQAEAAGACPHGRPVSISIGQGQFESWFSR